MSEAKGLKVSEILRYAQNNKKGERKNENHAEK
jgi:hypothetical protein